MNITKFPCDDCKTQNTYYACDQSSCEKYKEYKKLRNVKPIYIELAQIAFDTVLQTMIDGEKTHPANEWQNVDIMEHFRHAIDHLANWELDENDEDHLAHAITRLIMIRYLEANHENI